MKRVLLLGLVLLVILAGVPLLMAMPGMDNCPSCHLATGSVAMCLAVLALFVLFAPTAATLLARRNATLRLLFLRSGLERPPRAA